MHRTMASAVAHLWHDIRASKGNRCIVAAIAPFRRRNPILYPGPNFI